MKYLICFLIFRTLVLTNCNKNSGVEIIEGDEFWIGQHPSSDEELYNGSFDLNINGCDTDAGFRYCNNATHFTLDYKASKTSKACITAIFLFSYPEDSSEKKTSSSIHCEKGGIGKNDCFLVFKKMEKREDTWIQVYGKSNGGCNVDKEAEAGKPEIIYVDGPDEYKIGKQLETDLTLLTEYFNFTTNEPCSSLSTTNYKCFNNDTYFILDFETISHSCISAIVVESYPLDGRSYNTTSSIYCQKGGIGRNYCKLVFRKKEKREDASVTVYGILDPKACSLKERYIDSEPARRDAFGLTYYFLEKDGWSYYQPNLEKFTPQTRRETFQYKDGLINKPIYYLDRSDKYRRVREAFPTTKVHHITLKNSGPEKISFLDVYWFQEAQSEHPKMPYVYFQGHCDSTKPSCILVLDSEPGNQITYAFVKVFRNKDNSNMLRIREEDLGRGR